MSKPVQNQHPSVDPGNVRLALVGEAPGVDEVLQGRPFCGQSGRLLDQWLSSCGLSRAQVFVGNVCQERPSSSSNDFHLLEWSGPQVQDGITALASDLAKFNPHCVVAMGNAALHLLRHGNVSPLKSRKRRLFQWTSHVGTWRGSLFLADRAFDAFGAADLRMHERTRYVNLWPSRVLPNSGEAQGHVSCRDGASLVAGAASPGSLAGGNPVSTATIVLGEVKPSREGVLEAPISSREMSAKPSPSAPFKCVGTYHPAATFREPSFTFPLVRDLRRAVMEASTTSLTLPPRHITWGHSIEELAQRIDTIRTRREPVGFDIEGGLRGLQCCSFATTPSSAFVIDLMMLGADGPLTYQLLASVLEDPHVPKVCWNAAYERAILHAACAMTLRAYEDGMLAWWERFSELPKSLDFVASLLTREPYWADGIGWDKHTGAPKVRCEPFWQYNGIDSCVTLEIWQHATIRNVVEQRQCVPFEQP